MAPQKFLQEGVDTMHDTTGSDTTFDTKKLIRSNLIFWSLMLVLAFLMTGEARAENAPAKAEAKKGRVVRFLRVGGTMATFPFRFALRCVANVTSIVCINAAEMEERLDFTDYGSE